MFEQLDGSYGSFWLDGHRLQPGRILANTRQLLKNKPAERTWESLGISGNPLSPKEVAFVERGGLIQGLFLGLMRVFQARF